MRISVAIWNMADSVYELGEAHAYPQAFSIVSFASEPLSAGRKFLGPARKQPVPRVTDKGESEVSSIVVSMLQQLGLTNLMSRVVKERVDAACPICRVRLSILNTEEWQ